MIRRNALTAALVVFAATGCSRKRTADIPAPTPSPAPASTPTTTDRTAGPATGSTRNDGAAIRGTLEQRILFEYDQWRLTPEAERILRDKARILSEHGSITLLIEGHADERGSDEYNLVLSNRRAVEAKRFLVGLGVQESRLSVVGFGEERPIDRGQSETAYANNRRGEFRPTGIAE